MNERPLLTLLKVSLCWLARVSGLTGWLLGRLMEPGLYVFNYHDFSTFNNDYWRSGKLTDSGYGNNFRRQLEFFAKTFSPASRIDLDNPGARGHRYLLTFDDGYRDNALVALEALDAGGAPAAFMVTTGALGKASSLWHDRVRARFAHIEPRGWLGAIRLKRACKRAMISAKQRALAQKRPVVGLLGETGANTPQMMDWADLRDARRHEVKIGGHTRSHAMLSRLSSADKWREIYLCREAIARELDYAPELFAYPEGSPASFDEETKQILARCGFKFAFTTICGFNHSHTDPLELRRIGVNPSDPVAVVAMKTALVLVAHRLGNAGREGFWARRLAPLSPLLSASAGRETTG